MKAIVVRETGGPEQLVQQEVERPAPSAGQVLIRVLGTTVNFADIRMRRGTYPAGRAVPFIPGMDCAGVIEAVGDGVGPDLRPGRAVLAFPQGSYAEYVVAAEQLVTPLPEGVEPQAAQAAGLVACTAYELLTRAGALVQQETVMVHSAAGGVGSALVQIARTLGAGRVIGTVGHAQKADAARGLGADEVIAGGPDGWAQRVAELTDGRGVDLILNGVGGETVAADLTCLADFGRLVTYGHSSGGGGAVPSGAIYPHNQRVIGYSFGHIRRTRPQWVRATVEKVLALVAEGSLRLPVGGRFPLEQADQAQRLVESGESVGKILIDVARA